MTDQIKAIIHQYWKKEIDRNEFVKKIQAEIGGKKEDFRDLFQQIIQSKNQDELELGLAILYAVEENNDLIDLIHQLILEPWHREYEELAHDLQRRKQPESVPFLKEAMQKKYDYLESYGTGTRQFINQCGHALRSIGTEAAIEAIRTLSQSDDPVIKDEMRYRLSQIEGRNDYQRNLNDD
jgi:hypothetical protein